MGILNATPDSFSDGGRFVSSDAAVEQALRMVDDGAAIIDVGGESTRPGAAAVTVDEELQRVIPVIEALRRHSTVPVSIDTSKPEVMRAAVTAGAGLINDVRALREPGAAQAAQELNVPVCLMHMQGEPRDMQHSPHYDDVVAEVRAFLATRLAACRAAGISAPLLLDPGFGFGKTLEHNLVLFHHLQQLTTLGGPLLVGVSRKAMIGAVLDAPVGQRLYGSVALAALAVWNGARLIRVHDVRPTVEAIRMIEAVANAARC
ncbi:MAG: dihydropteroate synthase [Gammaproteobacteria bacterium]|nr:dihydropteroate synthase [Gammaproteobacteria bacterium]